eukprot:TRINITY_DN5366_c0_g1_i1.p1 TRINITY_DN5366_c0_g1~~TRINITY_DN5366_c0_g1_i1.p1  ORF type:complete len:143 (+),score=14.27 TRINITY_DN5366_c0_g1_i1:450-878(+)
MEKEEMELFSACYNGDLRAAQRFCQQGVNVNCGNVNEVTPLCAAVQEGHFEVVQYLLTEAGANLDQPTDKGVTPLFATSKLEIVQYLIDKGANVNHADNYGVTVLHSAAISGHLAVLQLLHDYKADINQPDNVSVMCATLRP